MPSRTSYSSGYRPTTTDSNQSRAHPCTEQNFTLSYPLIDFLTECGPLDDAAPVGVQLREGAQLGGRRRVQRFGPPIEDGSAERLGDQTKLLLVRACRLEEFLNVRGPVVEQPEQPVDDVD